MTGTFTNNGVLDLITGLQTRPANFVNNGTVLDSSVVKAQSVSIAGGNVSVTIQSYAGHNYQLQKRASLTAGTWGDVAGAVLAGTGNAITLTETGGATGTQGYYRVLISP